MADDQDGSLFDEGTLSGIRGSPTVLRIMVGAQLRRLREASGVTREEAAYLIRSSAAKMSRVESGRVGFKIRDIVDLLVMYGITDEAAQNSLIDLANMANEPDWWQRYNGAIPNWFSTYVGLEQAAAAIRCYQPQHVPDQMQIRSYASAMVELGLTIPADKVSQRVELLMDRQRILHIPNPPEYWTVIDEAVLRRNSGGRNIMRDQLSHILKVGRLPNITVQVVPFNRSDVVGIGGPFTLLRFAEPDLHDVVYLEQLNRALYITGDDDVKLYLEIFNRMAATALTPNESAELIAALRDKL